jgi:hypothetical protein
MRKRPVKTVWSAGSRPPKEVCEVPWLRSGRGCLCFTILFGYCSDESMGAMMVHVTHNVPQTTRVAAGLQKAMPTAIT